MQKVKTLEKNLVKCEITSCPTLVCIADEIKDGKTIRKSNGFIFHIRGLGYRVYCDKHLYMASYQRASHGFMPKG